MPNLMLVLEYDGAGYHGFQKQAGLPTIQGELEAAAQKLTGSWPRSVGASRTDAGAHALGQVVTFRTASSLPPSTWVRGLNFYLPPDIVVREAREVDETFHARRSASSREYRYRVWNSPVPSPFWRRYAHHVPYALDLASMKEAATALIGSHDFSAFARLGGSPGRSTQRRLMEAAVEKEGPLLAFRFVANAFLPQQVRSMVGTLLEVGRGKIGLPQVSCLLEGKGLLRAGPTAPAGGLCLVRVNYLPEVGRYEDLQP